MPARGEHGGCGLGVALGTIAAQPQGIRESTRRASTANAAAVSNNIVQSADAPLQLAAPGSSSLLCGQSPAANSALTSSGRTPRYPVSCGTEGGGTPPRLRTARRLGAAVLACRLASGMKKSLRRGLLMSGVPPGAPEAGRLRCERVKGRPLLLGASSMAVAAV